MVPAEFIKLFHDQALFTCTSTIRALSENKESMTKFRNTHDKTKFLDVSLVKRWKMKHVIEVLYAAENTFNPELCVARYMLMPIFWKTDRNGTFQSFYSINLPVVLKRKDHWQLIYPCKAKKLYTASFVKSVIRARYRTFSASRYHYSFNLKCP